VAIIDAHYYNNPGNEGHIVLTLYNVSNDAITIAKGERFAQGVFQKYLKTDDDVQTDVKRTGGYGSTGL
jgi:dUTP pyrophosphatase